MTIRIGGIKILPLLSICLLWLIAVQCKEEEPLPECPPYSVIPNSPYEDPVWHPNEEIIGFNHTPIQEIKYLNGIDCPLQASYIYKEDSAGFWLINEGGNNKRRVLNFKLQTPSWSPDGKWIAFVAGAQIFKMPFNGAEFDTTGIEQLTFEGRNFFPSWSPDGEWIAYDSNVDSPTGLNFVWKMRHDGSSKRRIVFTPEEGETRMPSWGKDFSIVFQGYVNNVAPEIFVVDSSGQNKLRVTENEHWESLPKFSPVNNEIISFISGPSTEGKTEMVTVSLKERPFEILGKADGINFSWSPEGSIVLLFFDNKGIDKAKGTLWVINADGTNHRQLTFNNFKTTY